MVRSKNIFTVLMVAILALSLFSSTFSQIPAAKRRIKREEMRRIEVYFDGGWSIPGMSPAGKAMDVGGISIEQLLDFSNQIIVDSLGMDTGIISASREHVGAIRSMGGGCNFYLTPEIGVGMKILFATYQGNDFHYYYLEDMETIIDEEQVLVDQRETYESTHTYFNAPIILTAFYKMKPFPSAPGFSVTLGGGPGLYTTSVKVHNRWQRDYTDFPPIFFGYSPPPSFVIYDDEYVAQPIGLQLFAGVDIKGSNTVSFSLKAEYNFVPEYSIPASGWHLFENYEHTLGMDYIVEAQEYYGSIFSDYHPQKMNISSFRGAVTVNFAF